ncbi:class I SAM-dependent methyltransferase [Leifsonia sp. NPDC058230]|uniref:class I SAM-dependent methyltransferase n=1 Tax=Leifsonia sp. NPDC058230 TaxID=3346391 RepID=UPI0036D98F07
MSDGTSGARPRLTRHEFVSGLHRVLQPRTYLEIGVENGFGLELSRARTIGIDPDFHITREVKAPLELARVTSDEFFARDDPLGFFEGTPIDLAFVDGMHLIEYAYRDLMNIEEFSAPATVVVFDDVLPRSVEEAARQRHTDAWTGDVFKLVGILRRHRPDLALLLVDTQPTGSLVVLGLDASSTVLADAYDGVIEGAVTDDPQDVPADLLARREALDPLDLLWWPGWHDLVRARGSAAAQPHAVADRVRADFPASLPERPAQRR